jgi:hypothetical protein
MAALEVLALNTTVPRIEAPQAGDTYTFPRAADVPLGTAALPAVAFTGDLNTGVFSPTADTFAVATGGTERMRVDASGFVGIGTTTPQSQLHIFGGLQFGTNADFVRLTYRDTNSFAFLCGPFGDYSLYLDSLKGNLGLGVVPSAWGSNFKAFESAGNSAFVVAGANVNGVTVSSNTYNDNTNFLYKTTGAAARYSINTNLHQWFNAPSGTAGTTISFTQAMTLDASGNLGLGVTAPQAQLQVGAKLGSGSNTYSFSGYKFGVENGSTRLVVPEITGFGQTSIALDVLLASVAAFANGTALLQFSGRDRGNDFNSGVLGYIGINKVTAANFAGDGNLVFGTTAAGSLTSTERMRLDSSGNLGLGTSTFGTSAATVFSIANGTEPSTGVADTVQFFSVDRSAGNTIPGIYCEGTGVTDAAITNVTVTNKIAIKVNGTVYYLLATTSAA